MYRAVDHLTRCLRRNHIVRIASMYSHIPSLRHNSAWDLLKPQFIRSPSVAAFSTAQKTVFCSADSWISLSVGIHLAYTGINSLNYDIISMIPLLYSKDGSCREFLPSKATSTWAVSCDLSMKQLVTSTLSRLHCQCDPLPRLIL